MNDHRFMTDPLAHLIFGAPIPPPLLLASCSPSYPPHILSPPSAYTCMTSAQIPHHTLPPPLLQAALLPELPASQSLTSLSYTCMTSQPKSHITPYLQAALLSELPALQSLNSLYLRLLDLTAYPLITPTLWVDTPTPSISSASSSDSISGASTQQLAPSTPSISSSDADEGWGAGEEGVNVDLEEAQHPCHESSVACVLPLAGTLRELRLERCCVRGRTLHQLCR